MARSLTPEKERELQDELFDEMLDLVKSTHWGKGDFRQIKDGKDLYCTVGLVRKVNGFYGTRISDTRMHRIAVMCNRLATALAKKTKKRKSVTSIYYWNDNSRRKREDVIALIEEAKKT